MAGPPPWFGATWSFIKYVVGYRRSMRPGIDALVTEHGQHARYVRLTSRRQANRFLDQVGAPPA